MLRLRDYIYALQGHKYLHVRSRMSQSEVWRRPNVSNSGLLPKRIFAGHQLLAGVSTAASLALFSWLRRRSRASFGEDGLLRNTGVLSPGTATLAECCSWLCAAVVLIRPPPPWLKYQVRSLKVNVSIAVDERKNTKQEKIRYNGLDLEALLIQAMLRCVQLFCLMPINVRHFILYMNHCNQSWFKEIPVRITPRPSGSLI